jgi:hypothetical protein
MKYNIKFKMRTIMFVERPKNKGRMVVDFQLCDFNYHYAPEGIIRIARFDSSFNPCYNKGYYGDIYMKRFIRKWKHKTLENIQRNRDISMAHILLDGKTCYDMKSHIASFL